MLKRGLALSVLVLLAWAATVKAQTGGEVRRPRGIYAWGTAGANIVDNALDNPAVSGLAIEVVWKAVNPNPPGTPNAYDWSTVDDAFSKVAQWNALHPSQPPKTIMTGLPPGFHTPQWVLDQIPSCDGLFMSPPQTPPSNCGKATFLGFVEGGGGVLPLPWNPVYKGAFKVFVTAFAARYASNPALVSIAIAGPTAASSEMILPANGNTPPQSQFGGILPNDMWLKLLAFAYPTQPAYQKSDQAFIDEWNAAIDVFAGIFKGITLVAWTGDGLPNLSPTGFTVPSAFKADCPVVNMDCAAETTILSHLVDPAVGTGDAKAAGEAGLRGIVFTNPGNLGSATAKRLSDSTAQFSSSGQVLAGFQLSKSFSNPATVVSQGCTSAFPPNANDRPAGCTIPSTCNYSVFDSACIPVTCIPQACLAPGVTPADLTSFSVLGNVPAKYLMPPEQGLYNTLRNYFNMTPDAAAFGGTPGTAPENYLQLWADDFAYTAKHSVAPAQVVRADGTVISATAQDLLNTASQKLLAISEPAPQITTVANAEGESPVIAPNTWVEIKGQNLAPVGFDRIWGDPDFVSSAMPAALSGVSATVNGKAAFVYYISPTQVNILTPPDAMQGSVEIQLNNGGASASFTATAQSLSPSFFVFGGGPYIAAVHANGTLLGPTSLYPGSTTPAKPGETVLLYANGFGPTRAPVVRGSTTQSGTLSPMPVIKIGGIAATVTFAGLVAPGEFQFNVVVPASLSDGDQPVTAAYNGSATQANVLITIQH